jgi:hypothetical protein
MSSNILPKFMFRYVTSIVQEDYPKVRLLIGVTQKDKLIMY